jgi:hypothetical protein
MGWLRGKEIAKGAPATRTIPHRFLPPHNPAQTPAARTTPHSIFFLSLPLGARNTLQTRDYWCIRRGMNDTLEATTGNAENSENGLKIVSGPSDQTLRLSVLTTAARAAAILVTAAIAERLQVPKERVKTVERKLGKSELAKLFSVK